MDKDILCDPRFSDKDRSIIITVMWAIWMSRNRWTHDHERNLLVSLVRRTREDLALLDLPRQQPLMLPGYGWRSPDATQVKVTLMLQFILMAATLEMEV